jgi:hypothetical protein
MSPIRSGYIELGLELVSLEEKLSFQSKRPPMVEEQIDEGVGDPINLLLMDVLAKHRKTMMNHFSQILQMLLTTTKEYLSSCHFGGITPFKVQVNFNIPIFEF